MDTKTQDDVPQPTLRRLPSYLHILRRFQVEGREMVSCPQIAEETKLNPTQIRKDLAAAGAIGRAKVGYRLTELIHSLEDFLGWNSISSAFLAGVGSLGSALLGHERFSQYGLEIVAAFDNDPAKVGHRVHGREVMPIDKLAGMSQRMYIHIGILTVPPQAAQAVADIMVLGGIRAVWNFAPTVLHCPPHVIVENVDLASSLAVLSSRLATVLRQESPGG